MKCKVRIATGAHMTLSLKVARLNALNMWRKHLKKLEELHLNGNRITRKGLDSLHDTPNLIALKEIDLRRNHLLYED